MFVATFWGLFEGSFHTFPIPFIFIKIQLLYNACIGNCRNFNLALAAISVGSTIFSLIPAREKAIGNSVHPRITLCATLFNQGF